MIHCGSSLALIEGEGGSEWREAEARGRQATPSDRTGRSGMGGSEKWLDRSKEVLPWSAQSLDTSSTQVLRFAQNDREKYFFQQL